VTVRVLDYSGDGAYFLADPAMELEGLRREGPGRILAGEAHQSVHAALAHVLAVPRADGRRALDVIVAAPKPVSVLLATEARHVARSVVELHERGVAEAFGYLCDEGLGSEEVPATRAVGFTHGVNRLLDPHLHTHVVLSLHDRRGAPVDARAVRAHAQAANSLYLATLRDGLPRAAGRSSWVTATGRMHVDGVDLGLVAAMSTPRDRRGRVERAGAKSHPGTEAVREHWDRVLAGHVPADIASPPPARTGRLDEYRFAAVLGDGFVSRRHVVRAWATACQFGQGIDGVLAAASLLAPGLTGGARRAAVVVRDDVGVGALGARPVGSDQLQSWLAGRAALERHLASGYSLGRVRDRRGATARERLSLARVDAAIRDARVPDRPQLGTALEASQYRSLS